MLGGLLQKLGVPLLTQGLAGALEAVDHPVASKAATALKALDGEIEQGKLSPDQLAAAGQKLAELRRVRAETKQSVLTAVNDTIRAEVASEDAYVRRMRPTFGYILALTWLGQMAAVAYVIVARPADAGAVIGQIAQLQAMWGVGLSVLGVYVYKRSQEKLGRPGGKGLQALVQKLAG